MLQEFLDLGSQPLANAYSIYQNSPTVYNLRVGLNTDNKMVQLMEYPPPSAIFTSDYPYSSSHSSYLVKHFRNIAEQIQENYNPKKILEIGTNDLPFLINFDVKTSVGIEPCKNFAEYGREKGYTIYDKFWNKETAKQVVEEQGKFDIVYAANCLCHIPNLTEAFQAIDYCLNSDGFLIFEDPSMLEVLRHNAWDQFYDEHVSMFSVSSLSNEIWQNTGMEIIDVEKLSIHGGSNRIYVKKKTNPNVHMQNDVIRYIEEEARNGMNRLETYQRFATRVQKSRSDIIEWLEFLKNNNYRVCGYGASSKATTIMNYCNINSKLIPYFIDTIPDKFEKYIPGTDIIIHRYTDDWWEAGDCKYAFIGAYNFTEQILEKEKDFKNHNGRFLTHSPVVRLT